jgi:hypothetical protein
MKDRVKLEEQYGELLELTTPSGFIVVLRSQNGEDDDILSANKDSADGTSINKFVAAIIVDSDITENGRLSLKDILNLKLCDKYFIIIASRIFSIGQTLKFEYKWEDIKMATPYEEDLSNFIWDYAADNFPTDPSDPAYFKYRIQPHKLGKTASRELSLLSGKRVKYDFINGLGEKYLLSLPSSEFSKNKELMARNLQLMVGASWVKVENFKPFSTTDMREIRNDVFELNDPILELATDIEHPLNGQVVPYPIVGTNDFFYPREI